MDTGTCLPSTVADKVEPPATNAAPTAATEGGGDCGRCGEVRALDASLMQDLNQQYERRLRIVEEHGDDPQFKVQLFSDWIKELRSINLDLVEAIQNIQDTCRTRIEQMRDNYKRNEARFGPEAAKRLEGDRNALLEVIRRAYTTGSWDISGIQFFNVSTDELFGKRADGSGDDVRKKEEPTISVNLAVSSNYPIENPQLEELRQELEAKERQIQNLEQLLEDKFPATGSEFENETSIRSTDSESKSQQPMMEQLKQMLLEKNQELKQRTQRIAELSKEVSKLNSMLEAMKESQKLQSASASDLNLNDSKLLQDLQNVSRVSSEELDATKRENGELRKQINTLKNQRDSQSIIDNQSLVDEVKNHYDRNRQLERKLRKCELSLAEANSAVQHRNKVIDQLRQDKNCLKKCIPQVPGHEPSASFNNNNLDQSESCTSLGSGSSSSSVETVIRSNDDLKSKLLELQATRHGQDNVIAELRGKLSANESEMRILRNDYDNNERKLFLIRTEIVRLIRATRENFSNSGISLPPSIRALEEFLSQPLIGVNLSDFTLDEKDQAILSCLQQHLGAIWQVFLQTQQNLGEIRVALEDYRQEIEMLQQQNRKNEQLIELLRTDRTEDKATSIDSDIMYEETINESLTAQRVRIQHVLQDMAKEISYLLGKDLSSESLSTFSELDATPLHYLIEDLKREIDAKDSLLQGKTECIVQLEEQLSAREKELHRIKMRHEPMEQERLGYEKRIQHLQEALREHDRTIEAFRQQNGILGQQLEDMSETLLTYKENLRRTVEEKTNVEDECKNQLVTICNLRSALEETKRNGGSTVSLRLHPLLGRGVANPASPGAGNNHFQPQHHHYYSSSNNSASTSATNTNTSSSSNNNTSSSNSSSSGSSYWSSFWRA